MYDGITAEDMPKLAEGRKRPGTDDLPGNENKQLQSDNI